MHKSRRSAFEPKLLTVWREGYSLKDFQADLLAGLIVGVVALPLAIAFAIASGVKPEQGVYPAVIAGLAISLLGGSRHQIGGPTGAFIVLVYQIVSRHGVGGLAAATLLAGLILLILGWSRLGSMIRFVPYPVTVGFTSGIAVVIFSSQIRDFLGLQLEKVPAEFLWKWASFWEARHSLSLPTLGVGILSLTVLLLGNRILRRLPGSLLALVVSTGLVALFAWPVETIATRFGSIPTGLPHPQMPSLGGMSATDLFSAALSIALLGALESLLSAVVADGMTGRRHRPNAELVAQGVANVLSPIFGGIPATGAIARTATNIRNGARSPIAGVVHALVLLLMMGVLGPLANRIPLATLAAVLLVVAWKMGEWSLFWRLLRGPKSDALVLLATFLLTVLVDLTVAIQAGMVLAAFLFMRRMAAVSRVRSLRDMVEDEDGVEDEGAIAPGSVPEGVGIYEIQGPFFFGAAEKFRDTLASSEDGMKALILRMRMVPAMDATGAQALEEVIRRLRHKGVFVVLSGVHPQPRSVLRRMGILDMLGEDRVCGDVGAALACTGNLVAGGQGLPGKISSGG